MGLPAALSRFEAILKGAVARAPAPVAAVFGDHVACGGTYVGLVVDILPRGTFVCEIRDPATGRVFPAPFYATHLLRVVKARP